MGVIMEKISFWTCFKRSAAVVVAWLLLRTLRKLFFEFNEFVELKNQFVAIDQKGLAVIVALLIIIVLWLGVSLIGAIGYFVYERFLKKLFS